jgi:hypothetical protein
LLRGLAVEKAREEAGGKAVATADAVVHRELA